jgi:hypothetical protein
MKHYANSYTIILILMMASALFVTACQDSVNPSLEESVAPYLELEAIDEASNTTITVNRGDEHGLDSYFAFDLSNIETNGLIREGVIEGWCLEWNKPIRQNNDVHQGVELYNTFGSDTWKKPNYLMSIKKELKANDPDLTYKEIQVALWALIETPSFNIDKVLQDGRMPSRMMTNGKPNFDVDKTKQIISRVRNEVKDFEYKPGGSVIIFSRTEDTQQNVGGVTGEKVIITNNEPYGWYFAVESPEATGSYESGPGTPPLGNGSAELTVADGNGRMLFARNEWRGLRLDEISQLTYSTYRSSGSSALAVSLQFNIDYDDSDTNTGWQGRLVYEPYYTNTVETGEWQNWNTQDDAGNGNWWASSAPESTACPISDPCTWSEVLSNFPNAEIRDSGYTGLLFKAGGGWTSGFEGNVDMFSIGINNNVTTYDFEP